MLVNMLKSCCSVGTVLRNFKLNRYLNLTGGVIKKKRNVWFLELPKVPKMSPKEKFEQVEKLKIAPEGYKLIYLSEDLKLIPFVRATAILFLGAAILIEITPYFYPDLIVLNPESGSREGVTLLSLIIGFIFYILGTRHVHYIFRNEQSYKTVYYGLFGKWQPRIIDHKAQELLTPNETSGLPFLYGLKGKSLIVTPQYFINQSEYLVLVKIGSKRERKYR